MRKLTIIKWRRGEEIYQTRRLPAEQKVWKTRDIRTRRNVKNKFEYNKQLIRKAEEEKHSYRKIQLEKIRLIQEVALDEQ